MGRKSLGESKLFVCSGCFTVCKRAVAAMNKKPCPKCGAENAFSLDKLKTVGQVEVPGTEIKNFRTGDYHFKDFIKQRPKVGDRIVFFSVLSGNMFLTNWSDTNESNYETHKNNLWLGPLIDPVKVA